MNDCIESWNHRKSFLFPSKREEFIARSGSADPNRFTAIKWRICDERFDRVTDRQGRGTLALSDEKKSDRKGKAPADRGSRGSPGDKDVGHALRSVYSSAVNEEIPPELLDLLGKLS